MEKIGIIGNGFVGSAVAYGMSAQCGYDSDIKIYDIDPLKRTHSLSEVVNNSDWVFISVPTPSKEDGSIDNSFVYQVFEDIEKVKIKQEHDTVFFLRSTCIVGTTRKIQEKYPKLNIVYNPEFLTERNAKFDFINPSRIVLGYNDLEQINSVVKKNKIKDFFSKRFSNVKIISCMYEEAEMIKYMANNYFAVKLAFLNEMYLIQKNNKKIDWDVVMDGFLSDGRIGHSHNKIALDGKLGYGGACLPKDIKAMYSYASKLGLDHDFNVLKGAIDSNTQLRGE